jgi:hypothetical protein
MQMQMQMAIGYSVRVGQRCIGRIGSAVGRFLFLSFLFFFFFFYPGLFRGGLTWFGWDLRFTAFYVFSTYFWRLECFAGSVFVFVLSF